MAKAKGSPLYGMEEADLVGLIEGTMENRRRGTVDCLFCKRFDARGDVGCKGCPIKARYGSCNGYKEHNTRNPYRRHHGEEAIEAASNRWLKQIEAMEV